jgi:hypothetical protein
VAWPSPALLTSKICQELLTDPSLQQQERRVKNAVPIQVLPRRIIEFDEGSHCSIRRPSFAEVLEFPFGFPAGIFDRFTLFSLGQTETVCLRRTDELGRRNICGAWLLVLRRDAMNETTTEPINFVSLYRRAFEEFGTSALWSSKPVPDPTPADALAITHSLRVEGNLEARLLAEQIERLCRAAL